MAWTKAILLAVKDVYIANVITCRCACTYQALAQDLTKRMKSRLRMGKHRIVS